MDYRLEGIRSPESPEQLEDYFSQSDYPEIQNEEEYIESEEDTDPSGVGLLIGFGAGAYGSVGISEELYTASGAPEEMALLFAAGITGMLIGDKAEDKLQWVNRKLGD